MVMNVLKKLGNWVLKFAARIKNVRTNTECMTLSSPLTWTGYQKEGTLVFDGFKPTWIVIHHSASTDSVTRNWDGIRAYHKSYRYQGDIITAERYDELLAAGKTAGLELPWSDIGYHLGIEAVGGMIAVQQGRPIGTVGAHAHGFNSKSVGICLVGNYDVTEPDDGRLFLLASVCRELQRQFSIARDQVIGHRETYPILGITVQKSCPGTAFDLVKFRKRLIDPVIA